MKSPEAKIVVLKNPYTEGSARAKLLALAGKTKTVGEFLKRAGEPSGGPAADYLSLFVRDGAAKIRRRIDTKKNSPTGSLFGISCGAFSICL